MTDPNSNKKKPEDGKGQSDNQKWLKNILTFFLWFAIGALIVTLLQGGS